MIKKSEVGKKPVEKPVEKKAPPKENKAVEKGAPKKEKEKANAVVKVSRKELSALIRQKIMDANAAISSKVAEMVVIAFEECVIEALMEGKQVALLGFGTFMSVDKQEIVRTNPQNPEQKITVPAHTVPRFKAGKQFKNALNPADTEDSEGVEITEVEEDDEE